MDFMTSEMLTTFSGATVAVAGLTEFLKQRIRKVKPKTIAYILSLTILTVIAISRGDFEILSLLLVPVNAYFVACAAIGVFETLIKPVERKLDE